jgi:hypothetical protein
MDRNEMGKTIATEKKISTVQEKRKLTINNLHASQEAVNDIFVIGSWEEEMEEKTLRIKTKNLRVL